MQKLNDFKRYIKDYFDNYVDKEPNETWQDYWEMIYDALEEERAIVVKNGQKFVKDMSELRKI